MAKRSLASLFHSHLVPHNKKGCNFYTYTNTHTHNDGMQFEYIWETWLTHVLLNRTTWHGELAHYRRLRDDFVGWGKGSSFALQYSRRATLTFAQVEMRTMDGKTRVTWILISIYQSDCKFMLNQKRYIYSAGFACCFVWSIREFRFITYFIQCIIFN